MYMTMYVQVLPDMGDAWQHYGRVVMDGADADMWQLKEMAGEKTSTYTFYVSLDGAPLKFHSVGRDYFAGVEGLGLHD